MSVQEGVIKVVSHYLGVAENEITLESHLKDDLNSDPLSLADLVVSLEDEFKISILPEESQRFTKVGDIVDYVSESIGEIWVGPLWVVLTACNHYSETANSQVCVRRNWKVPKNYF